MEDRIWPVDAIRKLSPLLACLATVTASKYAPAAVFPLLTPINKQRIQLLASDNDETWLQPFCARASDQCHHLLEIIGRGNFEPHPVSGEIEIESVEAPRYYREDLETMKAKVVVPDLDITVIYLWCTDVPSDASILPVDWRVMDILPGTRVIQSSEWELSLDKAEENYRRLHVATGNEHITPDIPGAPVSGNSLHTSTTKTTPDEDTLNDGYWDQYDKVAGETPAEQPSPPASFTYHGPGKPLKLNGCSHPTHDISNDAVDKPFTDDMAYFDRYANVQPSLSYHGAKDDSTNDNDPEPACVERSSFVTANTIHDPQQAPFEVRKPECNGIDSGIDDYNKKNNELNTISGHATALKPSLSLSDVAPVGIEQYVSNGIRGMYQLWLGAGLDPNTFMTTVQAEVTTLISHAAKQSAT